MSLLLHRLRRFVTGRPRNLEDAGLFHRLSLIPFLAWVGLGADGLSSSAYGPEEAFRSLGEHAWLAVILALMMAGTVLLISSGYSRIIEQFPAGGGGYVVASRLLGPTAGLVSGSALLVDYVLTIAISIAAAGDALFSFLPGEWAGARLTVEAFLILALVILNVRGVRESVLVLLPVFLLFLVTHVVVIVGGVVGHLPEVPDTARTIAADAREGWNALGFFGLLALLFRAYSLGGGTYTGIEAVSNGLPIMREPKVATGQRTMAYMAVSLAFTATGLLICYLLWDIGPVPGKTMNAVLVERLASGLPAGATFVVLTLFSEAMLLVVAAQAGFLDGPRVLANMAVDSWVPHRFAALSDRLTTGNGILLMGGAALLALVYTGGAVSQLVVMYAINVFLTFSLSMGSMLRHWLGGGTRALPERGRRIALFLAGFLLCVTILAVTVVEKFVEGGWLTLAITSLVVGGCALVRRHYAAVRASVDTLLAELGDLPSGGPIPDRPLPEITTGAPTAAILVGSWGGVGIHTTLNVFRSFPGHYRNLIFLGVGVVDSGDFKGGDAIEDLRRRTGDMLERYVSLARGLGVPAVARLRLGTDVVNEAERLCLDTAAEFPATTFFAGRLLFRRERWYDRLLHNRTATAIQERLQWAGRTMVTLPVRVRSGGPEERVSA